MALSLPDEPRHAHDAADAVQALSVVSRERVLPAWVVREVLSELTALLESLPIALDNVGRGLARSLDVPALVERPERNPVFQVAACKDHLFAASELLNRARTQLEEATRQIQSSANGI
ncbi:hypothetical protein [Leifsonia xyli]|uniref:hypothetical protein n=1 Tax=Leifsonia xyli TaxID=1575 RepID=UPI003D6798DD